MKTMAGPLAAAGAKPAAKAPEMRGAITEETPSIPQYFTWINNTNEGATEDQTRINLAFFKWLHDEYGMHLGVYAWDAGNIDSANYYGNMQSEKFKSQFPNGWKDIAALARSFSCRLGLWGGPDGFGDTPEEEAARTELLVSLCRDFGVRALQVRRGVRPVADEKRRLRADDDRVPEVAPDLVVLNHRLNLGHAKPHATTFLWEGAETYIDVHMCNRSTASPQPPGRPVARPAARASAPDGGPWRLPLVLPGFLGGRPGAAGLQPLPDPGAGDLRQPVAPAGR